MPERQSRYTRREFRGERHGTELASWLNQAEADKLAWVGRVIEVLAAAQELQSYATEDHAHVEQWWRPKAEPRATWGDSATERQKLEHRLASLLARYGGYTAIPRLNRSGEIRFEVAFNRYAAKQKTTPQKPAGRMSTGQIKRAMREIAEHHRRQWLAHGEWWALYALLNLAAEGAIDVVQRCQWQKCQRWFFRRFAHMKTCSAKCALHLYRTTDNWKTYHAKKQRERRAKK